MVQANEHWKPIDKTPFVAVPVHKDADDFNPQT